MVPEVQVLPQPPYPGHGVYHPDHPFDSDEEIIDEYDTDDSSTFGLDLPDAYPVRSVTLKTSDIKDIANPGVINSGPIDQWITAIILHFTPRKLHNFQILKQEVGLGQVLESTVKSIAVAARYINGALHRPVDDNKLKRLWIDFANVTELVDDGLRLHVKGSERYNVFGHLKPVTAFKETLHCSCRPRQPKTKIHHFLRIRNLRDLEKTFLSKVPVTSYGGLRHCRRCCRPLVSGGVTIPDKSWILVFELDGNPNVAYNDFQREMEFGEVNWTLKYITFAGPPTAEHDPLQFSLQFIGNRTFYYHGGRNGGHVKTFNDARLVQHSLMERAVYFRTPEED